MTPATQNKDKLNILYHHRTQGRGAEGVHITSIIKAFEAMGHEVTLLSPPGVDPLTNAGNAPVDKSKVKTSGISILWQWVSKHLPGFLFELAEIGYNFKAAKELDRALRSGQFDLVYERYAFFLIAGAMKAKKYGLPFVLEANEVSGLPDRARKQVFKSFCDKFEKYLFKHSTAIHTVSSYLKQLIVDKGVADSKVYVAPNAVDPNDYLQFQKQPKLREKLGIDSDDIVLGFAGWFDDWDRLDLLVDAFHSLATKHANIKLLLVGDGAVLDTVRTKTTNYQLDDKVILTGAVQRTEVRSYLAELDIAVFTHSNQFGSPVVMFEFMGLKTPIVAPSLLPITDVLSDKENALIFEPLNMSQMEQCLNRLIESAEERTRLAENAFTKLMNQHRWQDNAQMALDSIDHKAGIDESKA